MLVKEAMELMIQLALIHLPDITEFELVINKRLKKYTAKTIFERYLYLHNNTFIYKLKRIELSHIFVISNHITHVKHTILHEIAHALTPGHHHNDIWESKFKELTGYTATKNHPLEIDGIIMDSELYK